jgi:hypothetical protein
MTDCVVRLECGHEIDWTGPMTASAQVAQVCPYGDDWQRVASITSAGDGERDEQGVPDGEDGDGRPDGDGQGDQ